MKRSFRTILSPILIFSGLLFAFSASAGVCPTASPLGVGCTSDGGQQYYCNSSCRLMDSGYCPINSLTPVAPCAGLDACGVCNSCNASYLLCTASAYPTRSCTYNDPTLHCASLRNSNCNTGECASCTSGYSLCSVNYTCIATQSCETWETFNACTNSCEGTASPLRLSFDSAGNGNTGNNILQSANPVFLISPTSLVGIGTTTPEAKLSIVPTTGYAILSGNYKIGNVALPTADSDAATKGYVDSTITAIASSTSFWSGSGNNIWNTNSGNVGIGTAVPSTKFQVSASNPVMSFRESTILVNNAQINSILFNHSTTAGFATGIFSTATGSYNRGILTLAASSAFSDTADVTVADANFKAKPLSTELYKNIVFNTNSVSYKATTTNSGNLAFYFDHNAGAPKVALYSVAGGSYNLGDFRIAMNNLTDSSSVALTDTKFIVKSTGNVGIGTTAPQWNLHTVKSTVGGAGASIMIGNAAASTLGNSADLLFATWANENNAASAGAKISVINTQAGTGANAMTFFTKNTSGSVGEKLRIDSQGNVGIGTSTPTAMLSVAPTTGYAILAGNYKIGNVALPTADADAATKGYVDSTIASATSSFSGLPIGTAGQTLRHDGTNWLANSLFYNDGTNIGIGTTNPNSYKLNVAGRFVASGSALSVNFDSVAAEDTTSNLLYHSGALNLANVPFGYGTKTYLGNGKYRFVNTSGSQALIRFNVNLSDLVNGETYAVGINYENLSGVMTIDWCDRTTAGQVSASSGNGRLYGTAARSTYDSTYRFFDVQLAIGGSVDLYAEQVEYKTYATSYVPGDRNTGDLVLGGRLLSYGNGSSYFSGNVGIGTTTPNAKLNIYASSGAEFSLFDGFYNYNIGADSSNIGSNYWSVYKSSSDTYYKSATGGHLFLVDASEKMRVDRTGNIGIGTSTPTARLSVAPTTGYAILAGNYKIGNVALPTADADAATKGYVDSTIASATSSLNGLPIGTTGQTLRHDGTNWIANSVIYNNGTNVGIGTTTPTQKLSVNGNVGIWNNNTMNWYQDGGVTQRGFFGPGRNGDMSLVTDVNGDWMRIGVNSATLAFWLNGQATADDSPQITFSGDGDITTAGSLSVNGIGNSYISGHLGIGTSSPTATLSVAPSSGYAILAGNYRIGNVALPVVDSDAATKGYVDATIASATSSGGLPTGITGQTLRHNGTTWVASSNIFNNDTNVGIGTTNPGEKLELSKASLAANEFLGTKIIDAASGRQTKIGLLRNSGGDTTYNGIWFNQAIPSSSNFSFLSATGADSTFNATSNLYFRIGGTNVMQVTPNRGVSIGSTYFSTDPGLNNVIIQGNVGIGTTSPLARLSITPSTGYAILAGNYKIGNVAAPTADSDVVTLGWINSALSSINAVAIYATSTPATYAGSQSGYSGANALCAAVLAGTHVCTTGEIMNTINSGSGVAIPTGTTLWISNGPPGYTANANDCIGWTSATASNYGAVWIKLASGDGFGSLNSCGTARSFACCQ